MCVPGCLILGVNVRVERFFAFVIGEPDPAEMIMSLLNVGEELAIFILQAVSGALVL
jgi:hypothetical protein